MNTEDEKLVMEFRELLTLPHFKEILVHKLQELKISLSNDIRLYKAADSMLGFFTNKTTTADNKGQDVEFQLNRIGEGLWIPIFKHHLEYEVFQVLPAPVIDFMTGHDTQAGLIVARSSLEVPELPGRVFNLYFERPLKNLIVGVISEKNPNAEKTETPPPPDSQGLSSRDYVNLESLRSLIYYMISCPQLYHHMINQFQLAWKPLIDQQQKESS